MISKKPYSAILLIISLLLIVIAGALIASEVRSTTNSDCKANAIRMNAQDRNVGTTKIYDARPSGLFGCEYLVSEFDKAPEWQDDAWFNSMISIYDPSNTK